jgi:hypothetical protein
MDPITMGSMRYFNPAIFFDDSVLRFIPVLRPISPAYRLLSTRCCSLPCHQHAAGPPSALKASIGGLTGAHCHRRPPDNPKTLTLIVGAVATTVLIHRQVWRRRPHRRLTLSAPPSYSATTFFRLRITAVPPILFPSSPT